jgi:beta-lactamase superfamily II metal-dependent hydrolase
MYGLGGYSGVEIDMVSVGDADCIVVTEWVASFQYSVLIDGGSGADADRVKEFLLGRGYTHFDSVVCTHPHEDHAGGLIKIVQDTRFTFNHAWMHDITYNVAANDLKRASSGNSSEAEGVKQVIETTNELSSAFYSRNVSPRGPFAGSVISSFWPHLVVLGPSREFYEKILADFTKAPEPYSLYSALLGTSPSLGNLSALSGLGSKPPALVPWPATFGASVPLSGLLDNSSVKKNPTTQPFNNTSVILGSVFGNDQMLFTADAGAEALDRVPPQWKSVTWMQVPHHGSDGNLSQKNIERFHPKWAYISACGDSSHPSRAVVSGLIKAGAQVFSTHQNRNLFFTLGNVPQAGKEPAVAMKGTGSPEPAIDWQKLMGF